jgi:ethanolamine transporter EutH
VSYRDTSNYEPFGVENSRRPQRPFNKVQWTGVALAMIGIAIDLAYFANQLGWVRAPWSNPTLAVGPLILGVTLVNSRREPAHDLAPELAAARRRWLIIFTIVIVAVLGAATIIQFTGE